MGQHQAGAVGQLHDLLAAGASDRALADDGGALVPASAAAKTSAAPAVPLSVSTATGSVSAPSPAAAETGFLVLTAGLTVAEHARRHEELRRVVAEVEIAGGGAAQVDARA